MLKGYEMNNFLEAANKQTEVVATKTLRSDYLNRFVAYLDASPKTVDTYYKAVKQFLTWTNINNISQPTREDIITYKEGLLQKGYKPTTIQAYMTAVRLFFSWTELEGLYPNVAQHVKGGKLGQGYRKDYLTRPQVKAVLASIDTSTLRGLRDYAIIGLMITSGLRDIEVVRANIEDIRPAGENSVLYIQGKGHTEKDDFQNLDIDAEAAIRAYLKARGTASPEEPLFTSLDHKNTGSRLTTKSISRLVKTRLVEAGFDSPRLTAHSLRHTSITLAYLSGMPITDVQQHARHTNIATTMIYAHMLDKTKNKCASVVGNAIFH